MENRRRASFRFAPFAIVNARRITACGFSVAAF